MIVAFSSSRLSTFAIKSFVNVYKINQEEMEHDLKKYLTLEQLFIRRLKKGARPIHSDEDSVISPVDGVIQDMGKINAEKEIYVKGKSYSLSEMYGNDGCIDKYIDGYYMIFYLSPSHYHRIHCPFSGTIKKEWRLGTRSYPVNKLGLKYGKAPLTKNYRKMTEIYSNGIHITIAKIGAMYINSIHTTHDDLKIEKGEELAYFSFGSTVILLFEKDSFEVSSSILLPQEIRVGQKIGKIKKADWLG